MRALSALLLLVACTETLPGLPGADRAAVCGDGVQSVGEACDDGNRSDSDGCVGEQCSLAACGDGFLRSDLGPDEEGFEACDDGNTDNSDACRNDCQVARCGDGVVADGLLAEHPTYEECDDGNANDRDGCTSACRLPFCGDGAAQAGEQCDDGNDVDEDACRNDCSRARCGDGVRRADLTEGSLAECGRGLACADAREVCWDGRCVAEGYEACDDGNGADEDACTNRCQFAHCGDGVVRQDLAEGVDGFEHCDDGNTIDTDACTNACVGARMGDGIRRTDVLAGSADPCGDGLPECALGEVCRRGLCLSPDFEFCDDGDNDDGDGCTTDGFDIGRVPELAAQHCREILDEAPTDVTDQRIDDGETVYWVDGDGAFGPLPVHQVFCDMETDGGGWTLFVGQGNPAAIAGDCDDELPNANRHSCGPWTLVNDLGGIAGLANLTNSQVSRLRVQTLSPVRSWGMRPTIRLTPGYIINEVRWRGWARGAAFRPPGHPHTGALTPDELATAFCVDHGEEVETGWRWEVQETAGHVRLDDDSRSISWGASQSGLCGVSLSNVGLTPTPVTSIDLREVWVR